MTANAEQPDADDAQFDELIGDASQLLPEDVRMLAVQGIESTRSVHQHRHGFLGGLVNMAVVETTPGRAVVEMDVTPAARNPYGYVHGGTLFTLADNAVGLTCMTLVSDGASPVTLEARQTGSPTPERAASPRSVGRCTRAATW